MCSLNSIVSLALVSDFSRRAGLSEKWHSESLFRWIQIVHGCSPLHFCFRRLQLSHARRQRSRDPEDKLARGITTTAQTETVSGTEEIW